MSFSFRSPNKAAGGVRDRPDRLIRSGMTGIVVIDSVAALTSKAEIEGETGESKTGLQARLVSQALRKLTAGIGEIRTIRIFIDWLPLGRVSQGVALGGLSYCSMTGKRLLCRQRAARCSLRSGRLGIIPGLFPACRTAGNSAPPFAGTVNVCRSSNSKTNHRAQRPAILGLTAASQ